MFADFDLLALLPVNPENAIAQQAGVMQHCLAGSNALGLREHNQVDVIAGLFCLFLVFLTDRLKLEYCLSGQQRPCDGRKDSVDRCPNILRHNGGMAGLDRQGLFHVAIVVIDGIRPVFCQRVTVRHRLSGHAPDKTDQLVVIHHATTCGLNSCVTETRGSL